LLLVLRSLVEPSGPARLWTPANLATAPVVWVEAADPGIVVNGTSGVTSWPNKGSLGGTLSGSAPVLTTNAIGSSYPGAFFNATTDKINTSVNATLSGDLYLISVLKFKAGGSGTQAVFGHGWDNTTSGRVFYVYTSGNMVAFGSGYNQGTKTQAGTTGDSTAAHIYDGSVGTVSQAYLDGTSEVPSASTTGINPTVSAKPIYIGGSGTAQNTEGLQGYLGIALALDYTPSAVDIARLQGYVAWTTGTQANLPAGHPYKSAAPTISASRSRRVVMTMS